MNTFLCRYGYFVAVCRIGLFVLSLIEYVSWKNFLPENCPRLLRNMADGSTVENEASTVHMNDVIDHM